MAVTLSGPQARTDPACLAGLRSGCGVGKRPCSCLSLVGERWGEVQGRSKELAVSRVAAKSSHLSACG